MTSHTDAPPTPRGATVRELAAMSLALRASDLDAVSRDVMNHVVQNVVGFRS